MNLLNAPFALYQKNLEALGAEQSQQAGYIQMQNSGRARETWRSGT